MMLDDALSTGEDRDFDVKAFNYFFLLPMMKMKWSFDSIEINIHLPNLNDHYISNVNSINSEVIEEIFHHNDLFAFFSEEFLVNM